jgi:sulfite exporter TauE/SafE
MPIDVTLLSAFLVGVLGSTHCVGMCGGIVGALTLGVQGPRPLLAYLLAYNAGRIASYALAGTALGAASAVLLDSIPAAQIVGRVVSGAFVIALGLYRRIQPLGRRLLPVDHPLKALLLGLLWGWLPCGMVYAALAWSLTAGGAREGAALMTAFGVGTLPMLLAMGATARWLGAAARQPWLRRGVGVLLLAVGAYLLAAPGADGGHVHHVGLAEQASASA